jgi:molecular chaperone HscB
MTDPFALLGLGRAQAVDPADLDRRLRERAKAIHPDRAPAAERVRAAAASAELHAAHRTLRDPLARAAALLALAGHRKMPSPEPAFLEEQLDAREALARAQSAGDAEGVAAAREAAATALAASSARLAALLVPGAGPAALDDAAAELVRARFHASLLREAGAAAGPTPPGR